MKLMLHTPDGQSQLSAHYKYAFDHAGELYIVTAFLTEWDTSLKINPNCRVFRLIVGRDFGITRKAACEKVMKWLPAQRKRQFLVADRIGSGFHPKAIIWKEASGRSFAVIGSSNLTLAAFESNYEINAYSRLSGAEYTAAQKWIADIEAESAVVTADWLSRYKESRLGGVGSGRGRQRRAVSSPPLASFTLPKPAGVEREIAGRRRQLASHKTHRNGLIRLFRRCAAGQMSSDQFYAQLDRHWSREAGNRFQGRGWALSGKHSDFQPVSECFLNILRATDADRDDVVAQEIDRLADEQVPTRRSFFTEMLCLEFPNEYPVWNQPTADYFRTIKLRPPRGASEGAQYVYFAKTLRDALRRDRDHPAKNLAELDVSIWLDYDQGKA
jgi:HKD family nuclease